MRATPEIYEKYQAIGGAEWLRDAIESEHKKQFGDENKGA